MFLLTSLSLNSCQRLGVQYLIVFNASTSANGHFFYLRPILAIVALLSAAAVVLAGESIWRWRHDRSIEHEAMELGLAFSAGARPFEGSDVHGLPLLQGDPSTEAANVVRATIDGRQALLLELPCCEICEAETPHQHFTTVAAFRCPGGETPEFEIGKKSMWSKLNDALRKKPAVIDDREFAREFFVHCQEPKKVHDWLTPQKLAKLRPAPHQFHIDANSDWILIYRPGSRIPAAQFPAFLQETSRIAAALLQ
jgi:hypothetical protein